MSKFTCLFIFLAISSILFSFNASLYLYPGEPSSSITSTKFTQNGANYELISYGGVETFLLESGVPLNDTARITAALKEYDKGAVYPNQSEIDGVRQAFLDFNATRNANTSQTHGRGAEDICKQYLSLKVLPCNDEKTCYVAARVTCMRFGSDCKVDVLANYTQSFAQATDSMDREMAKIDSAFSQMSFENIYSNSIEISASVPILRENSNTVLTSKLRYDNTCGDCIAFCPSIPIDLAKLDSANTKLNELKTKVAVISSINQTAQQISNFTQTRLTHKVNVQLSGSYGETFLQMQKQARTTIDSAADAQKLVYDEAFNKDVTELGSLTLDIQSSISQNRFFGLNAAFERYRVLSGKLNNTMKNFTEPHDAAYALKENTTDELILAGWIVDKGNLEDVANYRSLQLRKYALDKSFSPPMSILTYRTLYYNFSKFSNDTKSFVQNHVSAKNTLYWLVGNIGRASVDGVLSLSSPVIDVNYKTRQAYSSIIPPILLILTDFSMISLSLVMFAGLIVRMRKYFIKRIVLVGWSVAILAFILVLAISSLGFYAVLNQASHSASFVEFKGELYKHNVSVIIADSSNATAGSKIAMDSCAQKVGAALKSSNISYVKYDIEDESCYISGNSTARTIDYCYSRMGDVPIFTLSYSPKNTTPQFLVVYSKEAKIAGDAYYFTRCDLAKVLS